MITDKKFDIFTTKAIEYIRKVSNVNLLDVEWVTLRYVHNLKTNIDLLNSGKTSTLMKKSLTALSKGFAYCDFWKNKRPILISFCDNR
jgi:hypothetical protein